MTLHVRPTCGTWAVLLPLADGKHADTLYRGNKEECEEFAKYAREALENLSMNGDAISLFGVDEDYLEELMNGYELKKNNFFQWLTDGKQGGALTMLTHYAK